jgi:cytochrome P450
MADSWGQAAVDRDAGRPIDIAQEMMEVALKIVGRALFSIDVRREAAELAQAVLVLREHIVGRARTLSLVPGFLPTPGNLRARAALARLDRFVYDLIAERRRMAVEGEALPDDLLTMLMQAQFEENSKSQFMTDRQLRDEVITLIIAGHETVASALAWTWRLLSQNPEACARLHEEVDTVPAGRLPSVEDLPRLPYTRMVFDEALRLYPPAWIITRRALAEDRIGPYRVPAGGLVVLSPYVTQRLAAFWTEPERFRPERFSPEEIAGRSKFAYFPFGAGPRLCIGNTFALVEAQLVLATVARRYDLESAAGRPVEVEPGVTLRPKHGLWMRPRVRTHRR